MKAEITIIKEHPLFSPDTLAKYLELKGGESTIRKLRLQGRLPPPDVLIGKRKLPRWRWNSIQKVIEEGEI
jgi:hypothetical protein